MIPLHFGDPFPGPVALGLGHGGQDREDQLGDAVAGRVAAQVDHVQRDTALLQLAQDVERIGYKTGPDEAVARRVLAGRNTCDARISGIGWLATLRLPELTD